MYKNPAFSTVRTHPHVLPCPYPHVPLCPYPRALLCPYPRVLPCPPPRLYSLTRTHSSCLPCAFYLCIYDPFHADILPSFHAARLPSFSLHVETCTLIHSLTTSLHVSFGLHPLCCIFNHVHPSSSLLKSLLLVASGSLHLRVVPRLTSYSLLHSLLDCVVTLISRLQQHWSIVTAPCSVLQPKVSFAPTALVDPTPLPTKHTNFFMSPDEFKCHSTLEPTRYGSHRSCSSLCLLIVRSFQLTVALYPVAYACSTALTLSLIHGERDIILTVMFTQLTLVYYEVQTPVPCMHTCCAMLRRSVQVPGNRYVQQSSHQTAVSKSCPLTPINRVLVAETLRYVHRGSCYILLIPRVPS